MKTILFAAIVFSITILFIAKPHADHEAEYGRIYNEANEHYSSKDYQNALLLYNELIERGVKNPYLFYNLGNTYFKLRQIGYAVLYYEKALALKPFDRDTRKNLEYTRRSLKERILPLYSEGFFKLLRITSSYIRPGLLAIFELFFFTCFILFALFFIFMQYSRNKLKKHLVVFALLFLIFGAAAFSYHFNEKNHPKGIVVKKEIEVLSAPIAESEVLFTLYEGTKTKSLEIREGWIRMRLNDGREGWILTQGIVFI